MPLPIMTDKTHEYMYLHNTFPGNSFLLVLEIITNGGIRLVSCDVFAGA